MAGGEFRNGDGFSFQVGYGVDATLYYDSVSSPRPVRLPEDHRIEGRQIRHDGGHGVDSVPVYINVSVLKGVKAGDYVVVENELHVNAVLLAKTALGAGLEALVEVLPPGVATPGHDTDPNGVTGGRSSGVPTATVIVASVAIIVALEGFRAITVASEQIAK